MPFQSQSQRRFMYSQKPDLAYKFEVETPAGKKLPEKKGMPKSSGNTDYNPYQAGTDPTRDQPSNARQAAYKEYLKGSM